jgi:ribosomal protein S18 acetylase RimI-like enzyme
LVPERSPYRLRPATAADYEFLYQLKVACLKEYVAATWRWDEAYQRQHFAAHFDPDHSQIVVTDGRDVGELSVVDRENGVLVSGIYILPEFQGRGLGTTILGDVIEHARMGRRPVSLQVLKVNPARHLYERLGFVISGESETHFQMRLN